MTGPAAPRTVAGWWSRLAPLSPAALAAGALSFTRTEALVEAGRRPLDPLARAVLAAVAVADPPTAAGVDRLLRLGDARQRVALADAARAGHLDGQRLALTDAGRSALADGAPVHERRRFAHRHGHAVALPDPGPFAVGGGVRAVGSSGWHALTLERDESVTAVVAATPAGVVGFVTGPPDWPLADAPTFTQPDGRGAFPELFGTVPEADARAAWLGWAQARAVPGADAARAALDGHRLVVTTTAEFAGWLRANRADVFGGGAWVWVGGGELRRAAVLDVRAAG